MGSLVEFMWSNYDQKYVYYITAVNKTVQEFNTFERPTLCNRITGGLWSDIIIASDDICLNDSSLDFKAQI